MIPRLKPILKKLPNKLANDLKKQLPEIDLQTQSKLGDLLNNVNNNTTLFHPNDKTLSDSIKELHKKSDKLETGVPDKTLLYPMKRTISNYSTNHGRLENDINRGRISFQDLVNKTQPSSNKTEEAYLKLEKRALNPKASNTKIQKDSNEQISKGYVPEFVSIILGVGKDRYKKFKDSLPRAISEGFVSSLLKEKEVDQMEKKLR